MKKQLLCLLVLCLVIPISSFKAPLPLKKNHSKNLKFAVVDLGGFFSGSKYYRIEGDNVTHRVTAVYQFDNVTVSDIGPVSWGPKISRWEYTTYPQVNIISNMTIDGVPFTGLTNYY